MDMLAGWSNYLPDLGDNEAVGASDRAKYERELEIVADLYQETAHLAEDDGKGIAKFIFDRVLYTVLDGKPR